MYEFEATLRLLVLVAAGLALTLGAGFGFKRLFRRPPHQVSEDRLGEVADRLAGLEHRLSELEERVDFTDRMLTDLRGRSQLPGKS